MKKFLILLILITSVSFAQKKKNSKLDNFKVKEKQVVPIQEIRDFLKVNEYIVTYASGDFNGDKLLDAVLVVGNEKEKHNDKTDSINYKRNLIILQRNAKGNLEKTLENEDVVYCYTCNSSQGSPLTSLVFKGNTFSVGHEAGKVNRWTRIITFEYEREKQLWWLIKDAASSYNIMNSNDMKSEVKTQNDFGFIYFQNYDAFSEDLTKQTTR
tara:strand:- start:1411 stop:2046 length:636 start_codon:yes stop_codon:yes gene_type:complete